MMGQARELKNLDKGKIAALARYYRKHLLDEVMPFWELRTKDQRCGGYLTCFDHSGNVTDTDKYIWFQGRQLWMFSALFNEVEKRQQWLELAKHGRDFIVAKAYAGEGRWNYHLGRNGEVKEGAVSIFTDLFILSGLCEYAVATGSDEDLELIRDTFDAVEKAIYDPEFKDVYPQAPDPRYKRHSVYMIPLNVAGIVEPVLGSQRVRPLTDHCLHQILHVFAKDEHECVFESVGRDGGFMDDDEGRKLNPGHVLESMWFCIEEGLKRQDQKIVDRAVKIADWAYCRGYDSQYGGIVSYLDSSGRQPKQTGWYKENDVPWHDKIWWVHSECLYALALCAVVTDSREFFDRFLDMHDWCRRHYHDPEYGEWYWQLHRDGRVKSADKGTLWKAAYHVPRAVMKVMKLLDSCRS